MSPVTSRPAEPEDNPYTQYARFEEKAMQAASEEPHPSAEELLDFATRRMDEIDKEIASLKDNRLAMERQARGAEKILAGKCEEARTRYQSVELDQQLFPSAWTSGSA